MCDILQVWCAATNVTADASTLSPDEHARAARFRFDRDRVRWIAAHVLLRRVLGEYLGCAPASLTFSYSEYGKPRIEGHPVRFNLSHSGDLAVCAITGVAQIGVDIEYMRPIEDMDSVFRSISSPREYAEFCVLLPALKSPAFFETWTMKEACVKAKGTGLSTPVADIEIPRGGDSWRIITSGSDSWSSIKFSPRLDYAGALAIYKSERSGFPEITLRTLDLNI